MYYGEFAMGDREVHYSSGSHITSFPNEGIVVAKTLKNQGKYNFNLGKIIIYLFLSFSTFVILNIGEDILGGDKIGREVDVPILGLYKSTGYIVLFGDSNCLDNSHLEIGNSCQIFV